MMNLLSRPKPPKPVEVKPLSAAQPFLVAIRDACLQGERFTLTAESRSDRFVVLVDRGGPFNVTGGGTTGTPALRAAAALTEGSYTVVAGWPISQPLYQIGLDDTLVELLGGHAAARQFPTPRGVDLLREGGASEAPDPHAALAVPSLPPLPAPAMGAIGQPLVAIPQFTAPAAPPPATTRVSAPTPVTTPRFAAATVFAPSTPARSASAPTSAPPATTPSTSAPRTAQVMSAERELLASLAPSMEPSAPSLTPGAPGTSRRQGTLKHFVTQALLWVVNIDDPDRFSLSQAWLMSRNAARAGVQELWLEAGAIFAREVGARVKDIKTDWEKSGDAARRVRTPGSKR